MKGAHKDFFPLDVAFEDAFFDRINERKRLKNNILRNTHTLITSPRRYGKTSLVFKIKNDLNTPFAAMDMMFATDAEKMQAVILNGISQVTALISTGKVKILKLARTIFQPFNMIESVELNGFSIKLYPYINKAPHLVVLDGLQRLEKLAAELKKRIILFFDEYQHVLDLPNILDFEKTLRSFAQTSKHVVCIFSGSNRHMLIQMFDDQSRPFYNLCDHILLERIAREVYQQHLYTLSKKEWGQPLTKETLELILDLTQCHTYYVNALCRRLWQSITWPDVPAVITAWQQLASEKRYEISSDFQSLTPIQRTILIELSRSPLKHLTSKESAQRIRASFTGITHAMEGLMAHDHVYQDDSGYYRVLNPLLEFVLRQAMERLY